MKSRLASPAPRMSIKTVLSAVCALGLASLVSPAGAAPIYWTDWQGADNDPGPGFSASGAITTTTSTVNVTYTNAQGIGFYQSAPGATDWWVNGSTGTRNDAISPYTSAAVDNSPTGTDIIALQYAGAQTLAFSTAVANPVFAFVSLNGNGYAFLNQDFNILSVGGENGKSCGYWGCGGVTKEVVQLANGDKLYELNSSNVGGGEPHGTIQFTGAFSTLTWTSASNEYWNGFTVGVQGTAAEVFPVTPAVPEPASYALMGLGIAAIGLYTRKRAR